jgi:outer membrane protein
MRNTFRRRGRNRVHGRVLRIALLLSSLQLTGCATWAINMAPDRPDQPWAPATTAEGEIIAGEPILPEQSKSSTYVLPSNRTLEGAPPALSALERHRAYSLAELIDIAQSNNPTTHNAWIDAKNAALVAGIVESAYFPRVSASIVGGDLRARNNNSALGQTLTTDIKADGSVSALTLEWLLFDFGERAGLVDAAKQGSVISNIAFTAAHQQVIYNVSLAFYANAAARARLDSAAKSLKDADEVQAAAENKYKQEIGTVVEVAQTRQATAEARLAHVQAEGAVQNAYLALISAIGISPTTRLKIADVSRRKLSAVSMQRIDRIVSAALARRPDVLTAYATMQASLANLRAAQATFFPKVFLTATGTRATGDINLSAIPGVGGQSPTVNLSGNQQALTTLIGATVPLYDGGVRAASLEQARDKVDRAGTILTQVRNEAVRQIVGAGNTLKTALSAYSASKELAAAAKTTFDAALSAYRNGVGSISDVTTAERQLLQANNAATDAYSTALSAAATLALAAGTLGSPP